MESYGFQPESQQPEVATPSSVDTLLQPNQTINIPSSFETESKFNKNQERKKKTRAVTQFIISNRQELVEFLNENGLDLLTSAVEFQQTGDFIVSSYVSYRGYKGAMEPMTAFLERYPILKEAATKIRDFMKPAQQGLEVVKI